MNNATSGPDNLTGVTPDTGLKVAASDASGPMLAADGRPLKASLNRALRRSKLRALALIAPLLIFILVSFVMPIADMLFRSVENEIVSQTLPRTVTELRDWDAATGETPAPAVYEALAQDLVVAVEQKAHTRLGSRLNYEATGTSSLFRKSGRQVSDFGEDAQDALEDFNEAWEEPETWVAMMADPDWITARSEWEADREAFQTQAREDGSNRRFTRAEPRFRLGEQAQALPLTAPLYAEFVAALQENGDSPAEDEPAPLIYEFLVRDLQNGADTSGFDATTAALLDAAPADDITITDYKAAFLDVDDDWGDTEFWATLQTYSPEYTPGYFLNSVDRQLTPEGVEIRPADEQIYITLFIRTMVMSLSIMGMCVLLGYPIAWLLANLPSKTANLLMILVLLPFWTSLLVRTSAWKVLLQQQGVINDILVWIGIVGDGDRLQLINNQTGTIIAMTHILLPFMILPLYSVMKTIPPSYLRAAKSLGATNFTAFRRVYFPQSVPGIGAGCILVFILSIGYYITPELVGGTKGVFISNRIAYHISTSLNWGLAAALGAILLAVVLILYWVYDRIVGIDNVKLGG